MHNPSHLFQISANRQYKYLNLINTNLRGQTQYLIPLEDVISQQNMVSPRNLYANFDEFKRQLTIHKLHYQFLAQTGPFYWFPNWTNQYKDYQLHQENTDSEYPIKLESDFPKFEESASTNNFLPKNEEESEKHSEPGHIKNVVTHMLDFFISEYGRMTHQELYQHRFKFGYSKVLLDLFDSLAQKYTLAHKSKEDTARFFLRKAITYLRDSLREKLNISAKAASVALCKRYFQTTSNQDTKVNMEDEKELLSFLLPYKKNSRNKTANAQFIKEIFASETFCRDYYDYLESFDEILEADNRKKKVRFIDFLVKCVEENSVDLVINYKRLPWLKSWLNSAKEIGYKIFDINKCRSEITKVKKEAQTKEENNVH